MSALVGGCLESGRDSNAGGAHFNFLTVEGIALATVADSLAAVKKLVFEDKTVEMPDLLKALDEAGLGTATLITADDLLKHEITIFKDIVRIDVQTATPGIEFEKAWENRETMDYEGQEFFVVSKADLIASKRAAGREVDMEDVRLLELNDD